MIRLSRRNAIKQAGLALTGWTLPFTFTLSELSMKSDTFEVIIIGGSYSGLSAAMALGRAMRRVLIIDSGLPCNRQTPQSHNFITHDGEKPSEIAEKAKEQVLKYTTIEFHADLAVSCRKDSTSFEVITQAGNKFHAKKLLFATGIKDVMPEIKGFSECWGISVIHCPYCHGYEFRGKKTGILAHGERALHLASLVNNLTDQITLLTFGNTPFNEEQLAKLDKHGISVVETDVLAIEHEQGHVKKVVFSDGSKTPFDAVYAALPFVQHSELPVALGCELTELGHIKTDMFQKTTVAGVFACGDNSSLMRSVAMAVSTGNIAGAMLNNELTAEQF